MKKLFLVAVVGMLAMACTSSTNQSQNRIYTNNTGRAYANNTANDAAKYQIIDQEFENYVVENDNYDRITPYEEQINISSYIQSTNGRSKTEKPHKVMVEKTVVDGNGNILSSNAKAPVTDQETLPDGAGI